MHQKNLEILNFFMKLNQTAIPKMSSVGSGLIGKGNSDITAFYNHMGRLPQGKEIKYFLALHSQEIFNGE